MRTDDLVALLASGETAVGRGAARGRFALALALGAVGALALMLTLLGLNRELARLSQWPMFWVKLAYAGALAGAALMLLARLSRPGARVGATATALAAPLLAMWLLAAFALAGADAAGRGGLIFGTTWRACALNIALLSLPLLAALLWAARGLAPVRPALAGAAAGFLAGATAALAYSLHCPELGAPFLAIWYPMGMLVPAAAGALLGPRLLRW